MKKPTTKFLLTTKLHMTQLFDENGNVVPVTVLAAQPNTITQIKTVEKEGYNSVQVGVGARRAKTVSKSVAGHTKATAADGQVFRHLSEFPVADGSAYKVGDTVAASQFTPGDKVKVQGFSKGKGFQGVVRRHGFHGQPASHGHKDQERAGGSIGAGGVQRTFKGLRMPGQMGNTHITLSGMKIVKVDAETNEIYVRGAVPGPRNTLIWIYQ